MIEMTPLRPCAGMLPLAIGAVTLSEVDLGYITSIATPKGRDGAVSEALRTSHGMALPKANRSSGSTKARAIWFDHRHVLLLGPAPDPTLRQHAALTDQSDGWAVVRLEGAAARACLARLVPADLSTRAMKRGGTLRTSLHHMSVSITHVGEQAFQIMALRSMAKTLVHDLQTAMESVAARG